MVAAEFEKLGIDASTSEITTSACVAGDYLSSKGVEGSYVYVIGEPALMSMLSERAGVRPIGGPDDAGKSKRTLQSEGHSGSRARGNGRSQLGSLLGNSESMDRPVTKR